MSDPDGSAAQDRTAATWGEAAFSAVLVGAAGVFFVKALAINSSAELWPRSLAGLLLVLSLILLIRNVAPLLAGGIAPRITVGPAGRRRLATAGWILLFCLAARHTGFGIALLVLMPPYIWFSGLRNPLTVIGSTLFMLLVVWLLFDVMADVPLWETGL